MTTVTFKGTPVHLSGKFPAVGQKAPDFALVNGSLEDKSLKSFGSVKKLLLIVPSLETSVCATCTRTFHAKTAGRQDLAFVVRFPHVPPLRKKI